jgi:integrase/recombinase XerC
MQLVGRPKLAKLLPKALPRPAVEALLETVALDQDLKRQTDWADRVLAIILTALLAGLRADEIRQVNVGDIRTTDDGAAVIYMNGKGGKERSMPIEAGLLPVIETYLRSRAARFPVLPGGRRMSRAQAYRNGPHGRRSSSAAMANGTLQSRIKRAFRRAGPAAQPVPGALVHGLRHTYCHRAGCLARQRLHPHEIAWPRINDNIATLLYCREHRHPERRSA